MFSKLKQIIIKLFNMKADKVGVATEGPADGCFSDCADDCPAREPEELYVPEITYRWAVKKPKKKAKKRKLKKKVQPKGKYGSQKKASPIKKTKPSKKGN